MHDRYWSIKYCSAINNEGLDEGMEWIADKLPEQIPQNIEVAEVKEQVVA